jgi:hypothetical protein
MGGWAPVPLTVEGVTTVICYEKSFGGTGFPTCANRLAGEDARQAALSMSSP